jgi:hypothetical protein
MIAADTVQELGFRGLLVKPTTARALGEAVHSALHGPPEAGGASTISVGH